MPPRDEGERAVIYVNDGDRTAAAIDKARKHSRARPDLRVVRVEVDTDGGEQFAKLVEQRMRGEIDVLVLPDISHLPGWIEIAGRKAPPQR